MQKLGIKLLELKDKISAKKCHEVFFVTLRLAIGRVTGEDSLGPAAGDLRNCLTEHLCRLLSEEARVVDVLLNSRGDFFHAVFMLAIDLGAVNGDTHLANRRIDLVDHRADDVEPFDGSTELDLALAYDGNRAAADRIVAAYFARCI